MASEMYGQDALASLFSPSAPANVCLYGHPRPLPTPAQTKTANTSFNCAITARPSFRWLLYVLLAIWIQQIFYINRQSTNSQKR